MTVNIQVTVSEDLIKILNGFVGRLETVLEKVSEKQISAAQVVPFVKPPETYSTTLAQEDTNPAPKKRQPKQKPAALDSAEAAFMGDDKHEHEDSNKAGIKDQYGSQILETKKASAQDFNFEDEEPIKEKPKKEKAVTLENVVDACSLRAAPVKEGAPSRRSEVLEILKSKFKVSSVTKLKLDEYALVIAAMTE